MAFSKVLLLAAFLAVSISGVLSYKILVMVPMPARSHYNLGKGAADILHERGHEITFVSCFPDAKSAFKREVGIPSLSLMKEENSPGFDMGKDSKLKLIWFLNTMIPMMIEGALKSDNLQELLNDKTVKFDLIVVEYFMNEVYLGLGVKYDCPVLVISPLTLMHFLARDTGNPVWPATIPNPFLSFTGEMTLMQRVGNTAMAVVLEIMSKVMFMPSQEALYKKYFPLEAARVNFSELKKKVGATLINSHPSIGTVRPLLPNAIEIGGFHIGAIKPLPEDLQKILDNAKHGVVFFSMGSNLKSKQLPVEKREAILKSLAKLKQTVLWKFESDLPGKPENVIIRDWLPQTAVLAHKNVRLFISHGGLLSCTEAASAGIPLLAIPIFGDQHYNAEATEKRGHGLVLQYDNLTETTLTATLNAMLTTDKFEKKAKDIYRLFHDRPMSPRDVLAFYAEHVIRTGGAAHLAPPRVGLASLLLLDVAAVVLTPLLIVLLVVLFLCKKLCGSKAKKEDKSKGKQKKN